jgi:homeobox protein YOX1/YHP1
VNYDYAHSGYNQWSSNTGRECQFTVLLCNAVICLDMHDSPVPYYESPDHGSGYAAQPNYPAYHSRPSPHHSAYNSGESRKLPPLNTSSLSSYGRDDRYHAYSDAPVHSSSSNPNIRSPVASYPASYTPYGNIDSSYGYPQMQSHFPHPSADTRSISPYPRSSTTHPTSPTSNSPPPGASPTTPEGNTPAKKKRKRADAHQLKILTDTYNRTAFPSTEERQRLAKELDMTPRSVQIW